MPFVDPYKRAELWPDNSGPLTQAFLASYGANQAAKRQQAQILAQQQAAEEEMTFRRDQALQDQDFQAKQNALLAQNRLGELQARDQGDVKQMETKSRWDNIEGYLKQDPDARPGLSAIYADPKNSDADKLSLAEEHIKKRQMEKGAKKTYSQKLQENTDVTDVLGPDGKTVVGRLYRYDNGTGKTQSNYVPLDKDKAAQKPPEDEAFKKMTKGQKYRVLMSDTKFPSVQETSPPDEMGESKTTSRDMNQAERDRYVLNMIDKMDALDNPQPNPGMVKSIVDILSLMGRGNGGADPQGLPQTLQGEGPTTGTLQGASSPEAEYERLKAAYLLNPTPEGHAAVMEAYRKAGGQ